MRVVGRKTEPGGRGLAHHSSVFVEERALHVTRFAVRKRENEKPTVLLLPIAARVNESQPLDHGAAERREKAAARPLAGRAEGKAASDGERGCGKKPPTRPPPLRGPRLLAGDSNGLLGSQLHAASDQTTRQWRA